MEESRKVAREQLFGVEVTVFSRKTCAVVLEGILASDSEGTGRSLFAKTENWKEFEIRGSCFVFPSLSFGYQMRGWFYELWEVACVNYVGFMQSRYWTGNVRSRRG